MTSYWYQCVVESSSIIPVHYSYQTPAVNNVDLSPYQIYWDVCKLILPKYVVCFTLLVIVLSIRQL